MAYIGNGRTLLIFGPNVRDDIIPDGTTITFELSQEVPGGYEGNVIVVRKRYLLDELVAGSTAIEVDGVTEEIKITTDEDLAAAFSIVQVPETDNEASNIVISGSLNGNDGAYRVSSVSYDGAEITIGIVGNLQDEIGNALTASWGRTTEWEILEPEIDYVIGGSGLQYNKLLTFGGGYIPIVDDQVYVIHKGDATYNFVPSQASVGPDQLQQNLRNFVCDRYDGDGAETTFALSQFAVNAKTLQVTLDGVVQEGRDVEFPSVAYTWELDVGGNSITFGTAPGGGVKVRILHLGFSTISRRATLSPGQVGALAPGTVNNAAIAPNAITSDKIDDGAVETSDLANDSVTAPKILLDNDTFLRWKDFGGTPTGLIKLSTADDILISSPNRTLFNASGAAQVILEDNLLRPDVTNDVALGNPTFQFKEIHVAGTSILGTTTMSSFTSNGNSVINGDLTITGTVDNTDVSDLVTTVNNLQTQVDDLLPAGTMIMYMKDAPAPTGWLRCDGAEVSQATYANLFAAIGTAFNIGGEGPGNFRLPDMRQRFPLGKAASGTGTGWGAGPTARAGAIDHTHIGGLHDHWMKDHTHNVPGHYHEKGLGSNIRIESSGTHTTTINIDHSHTASANSSTTGIILGIQSALANLTDNGHGHVMHGAGAHGHLINGTSRNSGNTSSNPSNWDKNNGEVAIVQSGVNADLPHAFPVGDHIHVLDNANSQITQTPHSHGINIVDFGHSHGITVNALGTTNRNNTATTDGSHSHGTADFNGKIGLVTGGENGNALFQTTTPNTANTDDGGQVDTSPNNPPFQTVHYIIKT